MKFMIIVTLMCSTLLRSVLSDVITHDRESFRLVLLLPCSLVFCFLLSLALSPNPSRDITPKLRTLSPETPPVRNGKARPTDGRTEESDFGVGSRMSIKFRVKYVWFALIIATI